MSRVCNICSAPLPPQATGRPRLTCADCASARSREYRREYRRKYRIKYRERLLAMGLLRKRVRGLTDEQVRIARECHAARKHLYPSALELARRFGVSVTLVHNAQRGHGYKDIPFPDAASLQRAAGLLPSSPAGGEAASS